MARQAQVRCRLLHPNINSFLGYTEFPSLCLVSSWAPNGSLEQLLVRAAQHRLPAGAAAGLLRDVAAGIAYLHSLRPGLVHRAISTRKILLTDQLRAVISDFTLSASLVEEGPDFRRVLRVIDPPRLHRPPAPWAAPEVQEGRELSRRVWFVVLLIVLERYGPPCDVFSWGVVAKAVLAASAGVGGALDELAARCTAPAPEGRPSADEVAGAAEEAAAAGGADWPGDDEACARSWGVWRREQPPGEQTSGGWLIAPKFKLA